MPVKIGLKYIDIWQESLEDEVRDYEKEEQLQGQIVFYGPSYFTRWSTRFGMVPLREALTGKSGAPCVVNRGFGSSCAEHQLYYYPRMIRPLNPKVLVYCPSVGNARAFGYTDEENWELAQRVIVYTMTDFPDIPIYLCGVTPCKKDEGREDSVRSKMRLNEWLREFAEEHPQCRFADLQAYTPLSSRMDIYVADGVHYNQEGYRLYGEFFREVLREELEKF